MEQLLDPEGMLHTAQQDAHSDIMDASKSWARLNEVHLDPVILQRHHIVTQTASEQSAPFDQLRSQILHHVQITGQSKLAITAAHRGAGSSTLTANLALSLARQTDLRVMVFDFDLRAPSLIHIFGLQAAGPRYSALLHHRRNFDSACLRVGGNLALSLNATPADDAAELLGHTKAAALLDHIDRDFTPDLVLFDLPALTPMDDALAALAHADCALVVAQADRTKTAQIDIAERRVAERTNCLGIVLNKCRFGDGAAHG